MNEKLLQYLWNLKIFTSFDFQDLDGNTIEVLDFGIWNFDSGPDFLHGKIRYNGVVLAGHIELHVRSSDWIFHHHSGNPEFSSVILHVVYMHDVEIPEFTEAGIPTLELKPYIDDALIVRYQELLLATQFIPCEKMINPKMLPIFFHEENLLKKLDSKATEIEEELQRNKNNYEAVLFHHLAYAFGLKVNADIFQQLAQSIDYTTFNKIRQNPVQLEALLFGTAGWLQDSVDSQTELWKREYDFLKIKYELSQAVLHPKFSRLRPPNFPTLRLSQLANLYALHHNLFSKIMQAPNLAALMDLFKNVKASNYWNNRFNFGKISPVKSEKYLTKDFIELIIINAVLTMKYAYTRQWDEAAADDIVSFYSKLPAEHNKIIDGWTGLDIVPENALQSQALLYHYQHCCLPKNCLQCGVGLHLMNRMPTAELL